MIKDRLTRRQAVRGDEAIRGTAERVPEIDWKTQAVKCDRKESKWRTRTLSRPGSCNFRE